MWACLGRFLAVQLQPPSDVHDHVPVWVVPAGADGRLLEEGPKTRPIVGAWIVRSSVDAWRIAIKVQDRPHPLSVGGCDLDWCPRVPKAGLVCLCYIRLEPALAIGGCPESIVLCRDALCGYPPGMIRGDALGRSPRRRVRCRAVIVDPVPATAAALQGPPDQPRPVSIIHPISSSCISHFQLACPPIGPVAFGRRVRHHRPCTRARIKNRKRVLAKKAKPLVGPAVRRAQTRFSARRFEKRRAKARTWSRGKHV
jgi:hypothetical protein